MNSAERRSRLKKAFDAASSEPERVTVRELMSWFGFERRGYRVIDRMRREIRRAGLKTEPDFASAHIDSHVRLVRREESNDSFTAADEQETSDVQLRVSSLVAATAGVTSVAPDDTIAVACSKMTLNDFSQLAVESGVRSLKGFISWETIGRQRLKSDPKYVREAMLTSPDVVSLDDPLLPILPIVAESNFVFARAPDQTLVGIITAADVTLEFQTLAGPYLLMGEIERQLRRFIDSVAEHSELVAVAFPGDDTREVGSAEDLNLGELIRLFESPSIWQRLGWRLDRVQFIKKLDDVRRVRNDLMHFADEPPTSADMAMLQAVARTVAGLHS